MDAASNVLSRIADALAQRGCAIERDFLPAPAIDALRLRARLLDAEGLLTPAAVGRGAARVVAPATRGDRIGWLDDAAHVAAERPLRDALEALRLAVNRTLVLGLLDVEAHYAIYPAGTGYSRHRDRFRDDDARILSSVLYLNRDWHSEDGGQLRLHLPQNPHMDIYPAAATLVLFLSAEFEHEVLPATRERLSVAGWFRRRSS